MNLIRHDEPTDLNMVAIQYKEALGLKAESLDVAATITEDMIATVKVDGELNALCYQQGKAHLGNNGKRTRTDCPPTDEVCALLPKYGVHAAVFMGELYAIGEDGGRIPLGEVQHIIQKPTPAQEMRMRYAVFDIIRINGKPVQDSYWKRLALLNDLFRDAEYVHPVIAARVDGRLLRDMWDKEVLSKKMEGLVVRTEGKAIKIKVTTPQDVVVIGVIEGRESMKGKMGALVVAYLDDAGKLHYAGKVGTGFTLSDRKSWWKFKDAEPAGKLVLDGDTVHMVNPSKVIIVESEALNISPKPVLEYNNGNYKLGVFKEPSCVGSKPRYAGMHPTKGFNPSDIGLRQVPDWEGEIPPYPGRENPPLIDATKLALPDTLPNDAARGALPPYIGPGDPVYGAFRSSVLGAAVAQGWAFAAEQGGFMSHRTEVPLIAAGNPPLANLLSCPEDGGRLVYYGRGDSATERGVLVYKCVVCHRAYRKRPGR